MKHPPSPRQQAILDWAAKGSGHCVVDAKAGTGKTSTLELLHAALSASRNRSGKAPSIVLFALNVHVVKEMRSRMPDADICTCHSAGKSAIGRHFRGRIEVDTKKYRKLVDETSKTYGLSDYERKEVAHVARWLIDRCRGLLRTPITLAVAEEVAEHYGAELCTAVDDHGIRQHSRRLTELAVQAAQTALDAGINAQKLGIDFTDMLYLPWRLDMAPFTRQWVLVDECQDLSPAGLDVVLRHVSPAQFKGRAIFVGDPQQAIYGFAGADPESVDKIIRRTHAKVLPLDVCYRCPASHVKHAQEIVPGIQPRPNAPEGVIEHVSEEKWPGLVKLGDLVISRCNAPLIRACWKLWGMGLRARVRGRRIGEELREELERLAGQCDGTVEGLVKVAREQAARQVALLIADGAEEDDPALVEAQDRADTVAALANLFAATSIEELLRRTVELFEGEEGEDLEKTTVWLSSIHRAKGSEAERVWIIRPDQLPLRARIEWQRVQEQNLVYIARTRSKYFLGYVGGKG